MHRIHDEPHEKPTAVDQLERIATALERLIDLYFERSQVELDARYPYGKPTDRFRRGA